MFNPIDYRRTLRKSVLCLSKINSRGNNGHDSADPFVARRDFPLLFLSANITTDRDATDNAAKMIGRKQL